MNDFTVFETKTELVFNKDLFRPYDFYKMTEVETNKSEVWQLLENKGDSLEFLIRSSLLEGCLNHYPIIKIINCNSVEYETWFKNLKVERIEFDKIKETMLTVDDK